MRQLTICLLLLPVLAGFALAADIGSLEWNQSNIDALRAMDKPAIAELVNDTRDTSGPVPRPSADEIGEFTWADLAGDGTYQLVLTEEVSRRFYNALIVYNRNSAGKLSAQEIDGWEIENLSNVIRDLNGDGRDELIIPSAQPCAEYENGGLHIWPAVYRLENGHYVEASHDFPNFYDNEVLPKLNEGISKARTEQTEVWLIMQRDTILRAIGRNPTAGLQQAYQWMNSNDPYLREEAAVVFGGLGGHKGELQTLRADENARVALKAKFAITHGPGCSTPWNRGRHQTIVNSRR